MTVLDALHYEFVRFRSLRSTWALLATGPVVQFLLALVWAGHGDLTTSQRFINCFIGLSLLLVVLPCTAVAVGAFGHEYRYRTITTTTLALRTPGRILGAKATVAAACGALSGVAMVVVSLLAEALRGAVPSDPGLIGQAFAGSALFTALSCLVGLSIAALSRNGMVAMVVMVVFPAIIETLLALTNFSPSLLPFHSAGMFVASTDPNRWTQPLPLLLITAVLLAATSASLRRRDA